MTSQITWIQVNPLAKIPGINGARESKTVLDSHKMGQLRNLMRFEDELKT